MFVALCKSHKTSSASACYLKNRDAIIYPPHAIKLAAFKFLKHEDLQASAITKKTIGFAARKGDLSKDIGNFQRSPSTKLSRYLPRTP